MKFYKLGGVLVFALAFSACTDDNAIPEAAEQVAEICTGEIVWCACAIDWSDESVMCFDPDCTRCDEMIGVRPQGSDFERITGSYECGGEMTWARADECLVLAGGQDSTWIPPHLR